MYLFDSHEIDVGGAGAATDSDHDENFVLEPEVETKRATNLDLELGLTASQSGRHVKGRI